MKRILLTLLLLALLPLVAQAGPARSKVAVIRVEPTAASGANQQTAWDYMNHYGAVIDKILSNRGIDAMYYTWDGDSTRLKTMLVDSAAAWDIEFAVFYGGWGNDLEGQTLNGGDIWRWVEPNRGDGLYCSVNAMWWSYALTDATEYDIGAAYSGYINDDDFASYYAPMYAGLDTFFVFSQTPGVKVATACLRSGSPAVDSILTYTGYDDLGADENDVVFWALTRGTLTNYYTSLQPGTPNLIIDAIICKNVEHFDPLYYAWDIDDFGMHAVGGEGGDVFGTFPNSEYVLNSTNFWNNIDSLFQTMEDYEMKLTVGAVAKHVRGYHADSNQYAEWYDLAQDWKDSDNLAWVSHNHGYESVDDSSTCTFLNRASYNAFGLRAGAYPANTTVARMDSLYDDEVDSLTAKYGITVSAYFIPPTDDVDGHYGDLKDTIAAMCAGNGIAIRSKISATAPYWCNQEYNGAKVLLAHYMTNTTAKDTLKCNDTDAAPGHNGKHRYLYATFFSPNFFRLNEVANMSPGARDELTWYNNDRKWATDSGNFEAQNSRITVLHFGGCIDATDNGKNVQMVRYVARHIAFLEDLAGKTLYECKFAHELASDKDCWRQVKR